MKYPIKNVFISLLAIVLLPHNMSGQPDRPEFVSPEVQKDRTATFRFLVPNTKELKLSTQFFAVLKSMTRGSLGLCTIKILIVKPDMTNNN